MRNSTFAMLLACGGFAFLVYGLTLEEPEPDTVTWSALQIDSGVIDNGTVGKPRYAYVARLPLEKLVEGAPEEFKYSTPPGAFVDQENPLSFYADAPLYQGVRPTEADWYKHFPGQGPMPDNWIFEVQAFMMKHLISSYPHLSKESNQTLREILGDRVLWFEEYILPEDLPRLQLDLDNASNVLLCVPPNERTRIPKPESLVRIEGYISRIQSLNWR